MMTWASQTTAAARFFLVLPLILQSFEAPEVAVWYLMGMLTTLQSYFDFGFGHTASRFYAYAKGGAIDVNAPHQSLGAPNEELIARLYRNLRLLYVPLGLVVGAFIGLIGVATLSAPVEASNSAATIWIAWAIMLTGSTVTLCGAGYASCLQGTGHVALVRRWETVTNFLSIVASIVVILAGYGLIGLAATGAFWSVVGVLRNRLLVLRLFPAFRNEERGAFDRELLAALWSGAWRSGTGVLLNAGAIRLSSALLAQWLDPSTLAAYLIAFSILDRVNLFAMAPFYSKLPDLAADYSRGDLARLERNAIRGATLTILVFCAAAATIGVAFEPLLALIGSSTPFIGHAFWWLLSLGTLVHRIGAIHLQLFTLSNKVVWHIADGVAGAIFCATWIALFPLFGVLAVPLGLLVAYAGFYTPYSVRKWWLWRRTVRGRIAKTSA